MTDCCSSTDTCTIKPKKYRCPENRQPCNEVSAKTIAHHLRQPWIWQPQGKRFFFCADPECDVVYFGEDDSIITRSQLRTQVGVKEISTDTLACYCFGISKAQAMQDSKLREYVVGQTKQAHCSCEIMNPSGKCCLKDFPKSGNN